VAGLLDRRGKTGVADEPARGREAGNIPDLGQEREAERLGDAGDRHQQPHPLRGVRERPQLALDRCDLPVEVVDHGQKCPNRLTPHRRHAALDQQLEGASLAQGRQVTRRPLCVSSPNAPLVAGVRRQTRWARRRSLSRSSRSLRDGTHTSGTSSRRTSSASRRASTRSVLHASGAERPANCGEDTARESGFGKPLDHVVYDQIEPWRIREQSAACGVASA
jgi:hypothetical protein